jgi:hypothetical protein
MELLPAEVRARLPKLGAQEGNSEPIVHVKYFTPGANWTWYATEGEEAEGDFRFFGYVFGMDGEWGIFTLSQLQSACVPLGMSIERDLHFTPAPLSEVLAREGKGKED